MYFDNAKVSVATREDTSGTKGGQICNMKQLSARIISPVIKREKEKRQSLYITYVSV